MNKYILLIGIMVTCLSLMAQKPKQPSSPKEIKVAMNSAAWDFPAGSVEFLNYKNTSALKILKGGNNVTIKDLKFSNGTVEFDVEAIQGATIYFHRKDNNEQETIYLR